MKQSYLLGIQITTREKNNTKYFFIYCYVEIEDEGFVWAYRYFRIEQAGKVIVGNMFTLSLPCSTICLFNRKNEQTCNDESCSTTSIYFS
jgi:hypothetical protein